MLQYQRDSRNGADSAIMDSAGIASQYLSLPRDNASLMIATLIGSTGLTGSFLVRHLLADSAITKVISISRKPLKISNAKLTEVLVSNLAELPLVESKIRGELYFCCLGTTIKTAGSKENFEKVDHAAIVAFAKISKAQDAKSFTLVSSMGANAQSMFFYNQVKGRTEDDVKALGLRSLIIFRPQYWLDRATNSVWRKGSRLRRWFRFRTSSRLELRRASLRKRKL
jgi:uncharacterized protein YbjT (DUF2867 family)